MSDQRGLFLDLGGTLVRVENDEIFTDTDGRIEFLDGTIQKIKRDSKEFDAVFVVTNQAGIEEGTVSLEQTRSFIDQVNTALGGLITDFWACPRKDSAYRKPNPGMIEGLADKHFVDLSRSVSVGDAESDRQAAEDAGVGQFIFSHTFFSWESE